MAPKCRVAKVPGFPGYFSGVDGSVWSRRNRGRTDGRWKALKQNPVGKYVAVSLCRGPGTEPYPIYVHHVVLMAFVGPRPRGMECIHKNDVQTDNRRVNLKWGTHKENCKLRRLNGGDTRRKLTDKLVRWILRTHVKLSFEEQAARCVVSVYAVQDAFYGRTWKHIPRSTAN